ncbi:twitchin-like isoform X1 [Mytilus galloprovincialis]|uniref:twitchin-like isoform X1 n=1 Tax=Mytilus galloprovincialis TaxID=29158 RepID=UPI003F7B92A8
MGIPEPTVTWKKDGRNLTNDGHYLISQDGGNCYLTIRGAKDRDQGLYTCIVANAAGENTCTAYMKLTEALKPGEHFDRESSLAPLIRKGTGEVPTMPYEKPTISDIRPESTRLTWQPVLTSALSPDSKNIKYLIEGRELPDADWRKLASGIHGNTHLLRNLRPQRDYDFRVRAENQFGVSDATTPAMLERPRTEVDDFADSMKSKVPQFRRPPELPKSKPLIADFGTDSVKLAWQPAYVPPAVKTAPPVSYRLEAQELPATDWLPLSSRLTDTSHYLSDLLSDRDYNIRVRAENKYGLSEPTDSIWIPRAKAFPGVPISRPEITEIEPHMVKLRWERVDVPSFSANDKELMYMIEMQAPPVRDWSTVARDIPGTVYVVSDLEPGQDYKFRVRARTPLGKMSEPSPVTSVYRTVATSRAPIDSFELEDQDVDFDGIRLKWNRVEIPSYGADEQPLLYMIEMNEPPLDEWRPIVSGLPTTRYRVTDLVPDRDYHFRVRALSSYGVSPPSYTLPVSYRRPLPGPSRVLSEYPQIVYDESDALQLAWQPPKISSHEPIRYRVELQAPPSLAWKPLATGIPDTRYPIRGLGPSRDYMFRVVPETRAGTLEPLPPVSLTSLPAPRTFLPSQPEILDYKPDSFMLSWRRPYVDTHLPVMYRIEMQEPPSLDWRPVVSDVADTRYHVTGLQPSRDYSFRIVPYSGSDYWEPLPPVTLTSMPVKPRFRSHEPTITPFGDDSIKLSWKPADIPMYQRTPVPIRYIVDMRTLPSYDWTPLTRNILDTSYIVKGLSPLKEYQFRVRPQTDYGIGEPTMPVTFYRKPVPMLRREPIISNIYGDSVLLSWQPAEIQGDFKFPPKVTYSIELQDRPGVGPWTAFLTGITGTNYQVTGLRPDREYFFRVRGHVGDIFGEPSAPVYLTHRAGPPKMPNEQPYISEMNPNSVHLQWRAVQLPSKITDYAPVTYRLEVQELPRSDWVILVDGIPHTDFHVTNLHPDREYNFRVRAINKYGYSEPTPLVQIRRRAVPPRMPKDEPMIYDIGHGSLMLSWRPADVPHYLSESPVTYTIYVQEPHSTTWRPLYRRIPYTSYHVTNLNPDRDYCFRVQAENQYGVSQPTNTIRLTRLSDFRSPIDIPEISEFDDTRSSLMLRWKPKQMAPFAGKPLKYHIESWEPVKRTWRSLARDIPDTSYRLTGLSPENDYILRVRAQAESALSEPSYPISTSRYRTKTPITRPQLFDVDSDSVRLSWQPYAGTITPRRYRLELRESSVPDWRPVTTDIYGTTHKVTGLKPKQDYEFRVRGITEKGPTDYVYSVPLHRRSVIPRMPLAGVDVVNVDDDYVDLSWRMVDIPAYSADDKPLAFLIEAQQLPRYDWLPVASGISDTSYRVKNLQRNQDYVFRIRGEYPSGLSQPSQHVPVYRRPSVYLQLLADLNVRPGVPITRPEIIDEDATSARLRWQRVYTPPYRHSEPISYQIEQQEAPHRNWRPLARGITMTEHTITDLMPKKDYLFRIRAESQNGDISAPTPPISYYKSPTNEVDFENQNVDLNNLPMKLENEIFTNLREIDDCLDSNKNGICVKDDIQSTQSHNLENKKSVRSNDTDNQNNNEAMETNMKEDNVKHNDDSELSHDYLCNSYKNEIVDSDTDENDFEAPSPRIPRKTVDYKMFEQDFSVPSRCYVDHLTTFIPPRLPLDKPDMTEDGPSTVSLRWRPAQVPERTRDKYPITYSIEVKNPPNFEWNDVESGLTGLSHTLKDIHPDVDYMFRIRAHNEFGSSEATLPVSLYRPIEVEQYYDDEYDSDYEVPFVTLGDCEAPIEEVPPKLPMETPRLTSVTGERAMLHWLSARIPAYAKKVPITYIVEIKEDNMPGFSHFQSGIIDPKFLIEGLNPNMSYQFRVKAETQFGCSDPTLAVSLDRNKEEEESELKLEDVRNLIQTLQDKVKRPLIDMKREDLEIPQVKMRDAAPKGVPPRMSSSRPLITNHYGGNLLLTWGPARVPSYVKGSSLKYTVEKREPPHSTWTVLADNVEDNEYDVTGLNPERDYMFRIRAKNQFGASDPTMPCSVINVRDDYVPPVFSRSQSRDSGTPRMSRRSSIESPLVLSRQISLDESDDMYRSGMPPEFKSTVEELQYGVLGKTARINLAVRSFPLPVIEWTFKGNNLSDKNKYKSIITPSGVITLDIFNLCLDDIGEYKCTAENDNGIKIIIVQLEYADAPTFIEPTEDMYLDSHKSGRFECKVDGIPYPKIRWMKDTRPITETSRLKIQHTKPNQWSLSLNDVISLDSGLYTCVAENVAGKSISSSNLFVDELETTTKQISFRESVFEDYYYPLEELGRGRHGIVRRVIQKSTGKEYAAKMIPACNEELKFFFGHELNNMRRINNQRVPSVIDAFQSERQLVIVMELVKGRSLVDHILSQDKWTEIEAVKYVKQLLEVLRNIHASSITHLDIKPSNIFLSSPDSDQIRLIDFGLSRHMSMDYDVKLNYGTEEFTSPEQIKNETVSSASDMWSVGILTYILLSGVSPLRGDNNSETLKKVMEGKINPLEENFKHVSEDAIDFLAELLVVDPCDRLSAAECLIHPWIKESADKSNSPLDLGPLVSFQARDLAQRKASSLRAIPRLHCLTSVLEQTVPVTPFTTAEEEESGNQTYPDCEYFGEYLDEESWYDWQNRYHRGPGAKVVPLTDAEYLSRVPGLRTTRRMTDVDDEDVETIVRRKMSVMEADRDIIEDPCLRKELRYVVVADDVKQRKKASKDLFPKDDTKDENPQIVSKFHDLAFTPGENIVLWCTLDIDEPPAVTWYRNEELVSESSRIYVKVIDNGTVLTVVSAKPYDAGIYKCVVRSKGGKATAAARVLVGDVSSQPSRPVATQVSSTQALLLWEPPTTNGNSYITGYRVDCRKTNGNSWLTVAHPIDECTIVKDLAPNTSYRFRVCAVNQFGFSAYSVASPEIVTTEDGDKIVLDEYTSAILARQSGVHLMPLPPSSGPVQLTEGSFSDKYNLTETVYSGKFSEIKIAENISTKRSYAAKIIPCVKDKNTTEFEILKLMNHEKVIKLYDGFLFSEKLYIITEYLCGVNVLQHFAFKSKYSEDMVAIVIRQILEGVQYLHHMGVVHLNLQPSSVVMRSRRHLDVKICGFSHARKLSGNGEVVPCEGYPDFIAPEIVTRKTASYSADTWTVGVLSFLLLSGDSPFRASSVEETYFNIAYSRYDAHSLYDNITRDALRFVNRIMKRIPSNRVSVEDCLEDKWLLVADTTVKARQEASFTTAKLRSFADLYRERGILGIWMPEELPETETESDENTDKKEKKTEEPTKTETETVPDTKENIKTEKQKDDIKVISQEDSSPVTSQKDDDIVESQQNVIDKVAETVVTDAMEDAFKSKELN